MFNTKLKASLLLVQIFVVSTCSLTYELLIGTASTNITGNSILAFSLAIGLFLAGLGLGAFASRWVQDEVLVQRFVLTETTLALVGGIGVILLYGAFVFSPHFELVKTVLTLLIGFFSGLEIPILTRILQKQEDSKLKSILANVLSFDYLGGLAASLLFPLILLPYFGLVRLSFLVGIINCLMAGLAIFLFWDYLKIKIGYIFYLGLVTVVLITGVIFSTQIYNFVESYLYADSILYSTQTKYQRIVLTKKNQDLRLYLNGGIQFSSTDEYRYHEGLVMPALANFLEQNPNKKVKIAVLGGGDGLAVRELLKFEDFIDQIYLIDLDKGVTDLAQNSYLLRDLNQNSLSNSKVKVINTDAWSWIQEQPKNSLDIIINDFPDPDETVISKLYSQEFFRFIYRALAPKGVLTTQSTSSYATPKAFWGIHKTLNSVFATTKPYNVYIPSFGLWGFNLAIKEGDFVLDQNLQNKATQQILQTNQFINQEGVSKIFALEPDILQPRLKNGQQIDLNELKINTLDNLILTNYYAQAGQEVY
jgi:spermidine synthase